MLETIQSWLTDLSSGVVSRLIGTLLTLLVGMSVIRVVMKIIKAALDKSKLDKAAHSLVASLARAVLYILLGLVLASGLGIDVTSVVALASVLSLAVSLSVQDALTNIIGGFTLLYTKPFTSGDYVEIAGQSGTIKEIGLAYTKLATPDNKLISIPNSAVVAAQIVNYSTTGTRRVEVVASASYDMDTRKVMDALLKAGNVDKILSDPAPQAVVAEYGESVIKYSLRVWVKTEDYWDVYFTINERLKRVFDEEGIKRSYPHLNVHLDK